MSEILQGLLDLGRIAPTDLQSGFHITERHDEFPVLVLCKRIDVFRGDERIAVDADEALLKFLLKFDQ